MVPVMSLHTEEHQRSICDDKPSYRSDIDGLRAIAVLSVVIFHAFPRILPGGFIGVDIFFVISGYLITRILAERALRGRIGYREFYARRINRIFPALITVTLSILAAGYFLLYTDEYLQLSSHILWSTFFSSNFALYLEAGYFDNVAESKPALHLWSLAVEEQFYIIWPAVIAATFRTPGITSRKALSLFMVTASFIACIYLTKKNLSAAYYLPFGRFWELGAGGLLALWQTRNVAEGRTARASSLIATTGATMLVLGLCFIHKGRGFPGAWALLPVLGTAMLIHAGPNARFNSVVLSRKVLVNIGLISYPLYLWHWPILAFARIVHGDRPPWTITLLLMAFASLLAAATFKRIEGPIQESNNSYKSGILLVTFIATGLIAASIVLSRGWPDRTPLKGNVATPQVLEQFAGPLWKYQNEPNCLKRFPLEEATRYTWWFCMTSRPSPPTMLLLGNSYANQLFPGIAFNPYLSHHSVLSIGTCDASGTLPKPLNDPSNPCAGERYVRQRVFIDAIIDNTPSLKYILIDGLPDKPQSDYLITLSKRIKWIQSHGITVIVLSPHLKPRFDTRSCFGRPLIASKAECFIPRTDINEANESFKRIKDMIGASNPGVLFFDQNEGICPAENCRYISDRKPLFRDETHLSEFGSKVVAASLVRWLALNLPSAIYAVGTHRGASPQ
jgi:peptidoglycan/LPS O-acetylase OafA/YrhL